MQIGAERSERTTRDARRSREALLRAAEELFAERGFEGTSLGEIAAAAGLSRGTPNYFFGSKTELYEAVLAGAFERREEATRRACAPLLEWAEGDGADPIEGPLTQAVEGYLGFLIDSPAFLRLVLREELAGASVLREVPRSSRAIEDAIGAVRGHAGSRGIGSFDTTDVVLLFVSLTFFPAAQGSTLMTSLGRDLADGATRDRHVRFVVEQLIAQIRG
jgi:TetR/AcrR family transcriptional regulator